MPTNQNAEKKVVPTTLFLGAIIDQCIQLVWPYRYTTMFIDIIGTNNRPLSVRIRLRNNIILKVALSAIGLLLTISI